MTYKVTATIKIEHDTAMTERLHVNTTVYDCDDIKHAFSKSFDKLTAMTDSLNTFGNATFKINKVEDILE
tara:strand:+ start:107 stop:316 length:210 start_codon:yes stop_codon:yes gene_type:complete